MAFGKAFDKFSNPEMESSGDEGSKKRNRDKEELFGRSKLTKRSPGNKNDGKEEQMIQMMTELMGRNEEMLEEIRNIRREQRENHKQIIELKEINTKLERELKLTDMRVKTLERENKKKNMVIKGIPMEKIDNKE